MAGTLTHRVERTGREHSILSCRHPFDTLGRRAPRLGLNDG
jgi:hypothetical protein